MTVSNEADISDKQNLHWPVISVVALRLGEHAWLLVKRVFSVSSLISNNLYLSKAPILKWMISYRRDIPRSLSSLPLLSISVEEVRRLAKNLVYGTNLTDHKPDYLRPFA